MKNFESFGAYQPTTANVGRENAEAVDGIVSNMGRAPNVRGARDSHYLLDIARRSSVQAGVSQRTFGGHKAAPHHKNTITNPSAGLCSVPPATSSGAGSMR